MRFRSAVIVAAVATLVVVGTGCTGPTPSGRPSATPDGKVGTLVIWADEGESAALAPFAARYGKAHGITVDLQPVPKDPQADLLTASRSGRSPDVVLGGHDWIGNLVRNGAIDPIAMSSGQKAAFAEPAIRAVTFNGQVYGVPYAVETVALIRNLDLASLPPVTIEEAVAIGRQLQAAGKVTDILALPVGPDGDPRAVYPLYTAAGAYLLGVRANGDYNPADLGLGQPEAVAAFAQIGALGEQGAGALRRSTTRDTALAAFTNRAVAYLVAGPEAMPAIKKAGIRYDVSPVPGFASGKAAQPLIAAQAFLVASKGRNKARAQDFVTSYATRTDVAAALYDVHHRPPALISAIEQVRQADPDAQRFLDVAKGGVVAPPLPEMGVVWDAFGKAEAAVVGGADVPAAVQAAATTIQAALG